MAARELYDFEEYKAKALETIEKIKKEQQPGQRVGKVGKNEILESVKNELAELVKDGYTVQQISSMFKDNKVFPVLPKTITQIIGDTNTTTTKKKKTKDKDATSTNTKKSATTEQDNAPVKSTTFEIKPDEEV
jgi:tRNA pseudouridine-54 N-methylase